MIKDHYLHTLGVLGPSILDHALDNVLGNVLDNALDNVLDCVLDDDLNNVLDYVLDNVLDDNLDAVLDYYYLHTHSFSRAGVMPVWNAAPILNEWDVYVPEINN